MHPAADPADRAEATSTLPGARREFTWELYLAGPMSGYAEHNFPAFNHAADLLRQQGYKVFNPAENIDGDTSQPRAFYMRLDIPALLASRAVALLPGWRQSRGANLEVWLAIDLALPVYACRLANDTVSLHLLRDLEPFPLPFLANAPAT